MEKIPVCQECLCNASLINDLSQPWNNHFNDEYRMKTIEKIISNMNSCEKCSANKFESFSPRLNEIIHIVRCMFANGENTLNAIKEGFNYSSEHYKKLSDKLTTKLEDYNKVVEKSVKLDKKLNQNLIQSEYTKEYILEIVESNFRLIKDNDILEKRVKELEDQLSLKK